MVLPNGVGDQPSVGGLASRLRELRHGGGQTGDAAGRIVAVQDSLADRFAEGPCGFLQCGTGSTFVLGLERGADRPDEVPNPRLDGVVSDSALLALPVPL